MTTFEEKILNEIKDKKITPTGKNVFLLREASIWVFLSLILFLVGIAMSIVIFLLFDIDWESFGDSDLYAHEKILHSIPYLWVGLVILFSILTYKLLLYTKTGYKKITNKLIIKTFLLLILTAIVLHLSSVAENLEGNASRIPYYRSLVFTKRDIWNAPEKGLLAGKITEITDNKSLTLKDSNKATWYIILSSITNSGNIEFKPGMKIKIIGRIIATSTFEAIEIRNW